MTDENGTSGCCLGPRRDRPVTADRRARILLVEDDLLIRDLLVDVLEAEGYVIVACVTPVQATLLLQPVSFDLVVTDGFSPVPEGVLASTAPVVRCADPTPVVLFSAHPINVTAAVAAGFRDVITKPFDLNTLIGQVSRCLKASLRPASEDQHVELRS
jgi:CheY-like chemotaxis protein